MKGRRGDERKGEERRGESGGSEAESCRIILLPSEYVFVTAVACWRGV